MCRKYFFPLILVISILGIPEQMSSQSTTFTCQNEAYQFLEKIIGVWNVRTKDRLAPGKYEFNKGRSIITEGIAGCGIKESYRGTFRSKDYAREVGITGIGSNKVAMVTLDSEHGAYSTLEGAIEANQLVTYWFRNKEVKRLQSKYILVISNENQFEFSSYLSQDYGATWALTHERIYTSATSGSGCK